MTTGRYRSEHSGFCEAVSHPDGNYFLVRPDQGAVEFLDSEHLQVSNTLPIPEHPARAMSMAISPSGRQLAVGTEWPLNAIRLWDLETSESRVLLGHKNSVEAVAFSRDGSRLVSVSRDQTGRLWNTETGEQVAVLDGHTDVIRGKLMFSRDGNRLFTCSRDKTIRVWDANTGESISVLLGHQGAVHDFDISVDGRALVSGDDHGEIRLWKLDQLERTILRGHTSFVYDCDISCDGRLIASSGWDNALRIWNVGSGKLELLWRAPNPDSSWTPRICQTVFQPGAQRIAVFESAEPLPRAGFIYVIDLQLGEQLLKIGVPEGLCMNKCLDFDPSGEFLACGIRNGSVRVWSATTGDMIEEWDQVTNQVRSLCYDRTGDWLYVGGAHGDIHALPTNGANARCLIGKHKNAVTSLAVSWDNRYLASSSDDYTVGIWDILNRQHVATLDHHGRAYKIVFHPNGTRLGNSGGRQRYPPLGHRDLGYRSQAKRARRLRTWSGI